MNLRTEKRVARRRNSKKEEKSLLIYAGVYTLIIGCLFTSVFGATLYFDGQSQKMNQGIAQIDSNSYRLQREIQNLKIKLASYSRKEYIDSRIKKYRLGLNTPAPFQIVYLKSAENDYHNRISAPQIVSNQSPYEKVRRARFTARRKRFAVSSQPFINNFGRELYKKTANGTLRTAYDVTEKVSTCQTLRIAMRSDNKILHSG